MKSIKKIVFVGKGFAHAHKDNGVDRVAFLFEIEILAGDFVGGEILFEANGAGGTELTAHGTA